MHLDPQIRTIINILRIINTIVDCYVDLRWSDVKFLFQDKTVSRCEMIHLQVHGTRFGGKLITKAQRNNINAENLGEKERERQTR